MTDIVDELRARALQGRFNLEAADEIERLRAELDAFRNNYTLALGAIDALSAELDALKGQEPVAWRTFDGEGGYDYRSFSDNEDYRDEFIERNPNYATWVEPLYAHPTPAQSVPWVSVSRCLPNPEEHPRVLIYTEEYAFDGEQVFDVRAESLNERFFTHPDEQPEVCGVASHWMPHPANTNLIPLAYKGWTTNEADEETALHLLKDAADKLGYRLVKKRS